MTVSSTGGRGPAAQAAILAATTVLSQIAVAVIYVLAARWSSPADYGLVVSAVAVGTVAAGVFDFGANSLWIREIASGRLVPSEASNRAMTKLLIAGILSAISGITLITAFPTSSVWVAAPVAFATVTGFVFQIPLRAAAQSHLTAVGVVAGRFLGLVLLLTLVAAGASPTDSLWVSLVAGALAEAAIHIVVTPANRRYQLRGVALRNPWKGSAHYGIHAIASSMQTLDLPLLTALGGASAGGLYGAVNRWTQPLGIATSAYTSASTPFLARARRWQDVSAHLRAGLWMPALAILACLGVAVGAPWIVPVLLGTQYTESAGVLTVLALGTVPAIANQPLANFLQALGRDALVARIMASTVLTRLVLVALSAGVCGAMGAAIAFGLTQVLMCAVLVPVFMATIRRWRMQNEE